MDVVNSVKIQFAFQISRLGVSVQDRSKQRVSRKRETQHPLRPHSNITRVLQVHEPALSAAPWNGAVDVGAKGQDDGRAEQAVYAAINCMLDQVNACLDHMEERNDHLPCRLQECLNPTGKLTLRSSTCSGRNQSIGSP